MKTQINKPKKGTVMTLLLSQHLIDLDATAEVADIEYMSDGHNCGTIGKVFGVAEIGSWTVGPSLGGDGELGCYDRWHVYSATGDVVGDLRDDAPGYAFHDPEGTHMTTTYTIYPATREEITAGDLNYEMDAMDQRGEAYTCYTVARWDAETTEYLGSQYDLSVVMTDCDRVGICTNATSDWADYATVEEAVHDYLFSNDEFMSRN